MVVKWGQVPGKKSKIEFKSFVEKNEFYILLDLSIIATVHRCGLQVFLLTEGYHGDEIDILLNMSVIIILNITIRMFA